MASDPYLLGLRQLARREMSRLQLRGWLLRRVDDEAAVDAALERLEAERALDDRRTAEAFAHDSSQLKHQGRARIHRGLVAMGIAPSVADEALDGVTSREEEEASLRRELARRSRGMPIDNDRTRRRLFAALVRQGFDPERVRLALRGRGPESDDSA